MPIVVHASVPPVPATDSQTPDGRMRATVMPGSAGVFLRADYRDLFGDPGYVFPNPLKVTFWRTDENGTTTPVRGADGAHQYGGVIHAYDDEVRFGQQVVYWAEAPLKDGSETVETGRVAVRTWEPDGGFTSPGVWIKNLENPDLSVPARCVDWSSGSWSSRNATADVWGSPDPAVVTDVRKGYNTKMTILTADEDEYQALLEAVNSSMVYIVGLERHRRRTGYYLIGDIAPSRLGKPHSSYDSWDVALLGIGRPSTSGQSLTVPGRSYRERKAANGSYRATQDAPGRLGYRAHNDILNPGTEVDLADTVAYASAARERVTSEKRSGLASTKITNASGTFGGNQWILGRTYTEGQTVTASAWVKIPGTGTTVFFAFRNASTTVGTSSAGTPTSGQWARVNATYTVPAGQTVDRVTVAYNAAPGVIWYADDIMAEPGSDLHDYGDGSLGGGWNWDGTPNASASTYGRVYADGTEPY